MYIALEVDLISVGTRACMQYRKAYLSAMSAREIVAYEVLATNYDPVITGKSIFRKTLESSSPTWPLKDSMIFSIIRSS